jgi:hypothetical protein
VTTVMADVEFGSLKKLHYRTSDISKVLQGIVGRQSIAIWLDDGLIRSYRTEGRQRAGERYVKHADLVAFLRSKGDQYRESLILIGEEPGEPPPARAGRKR